MSAHSAIGPAESTTTIDLTHGWRADVCHNWDLDDDVVAEWTVLARAYGDRGIFLHPGWLRTWWETFGTGGRLYVVVLRHQGTLRAICPCWLSADGELGGLSNEVYFDFLLTGPDRRETLLRFLHVVDRSGCARAHLPSLSLRQSCAEALLEQLTSTKRPCWTLSEAFGATIDVHRSSWEEVDASFHPRLRNSLRKGRKRAEKEGALTFDTVTAKAGLDAALDEAFAVEGSGWKAESGSAIVFSEEKKAWYRSISRWAAEAGALRLSELRLNGRLIAFDLGVSSGRTVFALKTGFDERVASRLSAGNVMRYEQLKRLWADPGTDWYDFLGATYPWKKEWTDLSDVCVDVFAYPQTVSGWLRYLGTHAWKQPLKRSAGLVTLVQRLRGGHRGSQHGG